MLFMREYSAEKFDWISPSRKLNDINLNTFVQDSEDTVSEFSDRRLRKMPHFEIPSTTYNIGAYL